MPLNIDSSLFYYAVVGFAAALAAAVWMYVDSRKNNNEATWVSFVATLGPLVTVAGAMLGGAELLGFPLIDAAYAEIMRNLLWLSVAGGVVMLIAALYYASAVRQSAGGGDEYAIDGNRTEFDVGRGGAEALASTPAPGNLAPVEGYMIGGGMQNETVFIRPDGAVEGVIAWLTYLTDPHRGTEIPLNTDAFVGRDNGCEIVVDDPEVSGRHARLQYGDDKRFMLRDVGSTNGTFVNGDRVEVHALQDHDVVRIGTTELEFFWVRQRPDVPGALAYRATLLLQTGDQRGDTISLNQDKLIIGSSARCDVRLAEEGVAGVHAVLSRDGDSYVLSSIGDAAVKVNGHAIDERTLADRDEIAVGKARMLFRDGLDQ